MTFKKLLKLPTTLHLLAFALLYTFVIFGCNKYKDPPPTITDKLITPYCNIPSAVNYNWGFPGIVTNSVCIYPADLFIGTYIFTDSVLDANLEYVPFATNTITITKVTDTTIKLLGLCANTTSNFTAKATRNFRFALDSTTTLGQVFCTNSDTINGNGSKLLFSDTIFKFTYNLINNAVVKEHKGVFIKQ